MDNMENTSGQGAGVIVPYEVRKWNGGWNWGAFWFEWLWGINHNVWISLLTLIPYVNLVMAIVLGIKGNEWAWQQRRWDSVEQFQRTQRIWSNWGLGIFIAVFAIVMVICYMAGSQ